MPGLYNTGANSLKDHFGSQTGAVVTGVVWTSLKLAHWCGFVPTIVA